MLSSSIKLREDSELLTFLEKELLWGFEKYDGCLTITLQNEPSCDYIEHSKAGTWHLRSNTFITSSYDKLAGCFHSILRGEVDDFGDHWADLITLIRENALDQYLFSKLDYYEWELRLYLGNYLPKVLTGVIAEYLIPTDFSLFSEELDLSYDLVGQAFHLRVRHRGDLLISLDFGGVIGSTSMLPPEPEKSHGNNLLEELLNRTHMEPHGMVKLS